MVITTTTALAFPMMGCGTWAWGNRLLWDYDPSMDEQLRLVFDECVRNGATFFDTGDSYGTGRFNGRSEQLLGQFSSGYSGPNRGDICLATKLAAYPWRLTQRSIVRACQASAQRLRRSVDLVQLHWSTANYAPWQDRVLLDGLADLYEQGLVKGVGLSNFGPRRLRWVQRRLAARGVPIATLQVQYSLLSTAPVSKLGVKEVCDEFGIQLIAYSPLALGMLTGKYAVTDPLPKGLRGQLFRQILPGAQPVLGCLVAIATQRHKTMAQIALNWCIAKGTLPIPGAKTLAQVRENLGALGWSLEAGEVSALDQAAAAGTKTMVQNIFQSR